MSRDRIILWLLLPLTALTLATYAWLTLWSSEPSELSESPEPFHSPDARVVRWVSPDGSTRPRLERPRGLSEAMERSAQKLPDDSLEAQAVAALAPLVNECFADVAQRHPGAKRVILSFRANPSGSLDEAQVVESTVQDPWLQACFLEAVADAHFPPSVGGVPERVTRAFSFVLEADGG
jgi:hypothetical protein